MPRITIREIDQTGSEQTSYVENIVLIPAIQISLNTTKSAVDPNDEKKTVKTTYKFDIDGLYETKKAFANAIANYEAMCEAAGVTPVAYAADKGYQMAVALLGNGLPIQYAGLYDEDGYIVNTQIKVTSEDTAAKQAIDAWMDEYSDRGKYDIRFIFPGAVENKYLNCAALTCASDRADAIAILNVPEQQCATVTAIQTYLVNSGLKALAAENMTRNGVTWTSAEKQENYRGKYGAIFAPYFTGSLVDSNSQAIDLPASFGFLSSFGNNSGKYASWFATAGSIRGISPYAPLTTTVEYGEADINALQVRSDEEKAVAVNVICNIRPYGNIIWGNRTMKPLSAPDNGSSDAVQLTASSFLNIRQLCCDIKKTLYRVSRKYTYEPNSDILWSNFKASITPLLDKMSSNQGIRGYKITRILTNAKAVLAAKIQIVPIEAVEDFDLTVELDDDITVTE